MVVVVIVVVVVVVVVFVVSETHTHALGNSISALNSSLPLLPPASGMLDVCGLLHTRQLCGKE